MTYNNSGFLGVLCSCRNSVFPRVFLRSLFFAAVGGLALYLYDYSDKRSNKGETVCPSPRRQLCAPSQLLDNRF